MIFYIILLFVVGFVLSIFYYLYTRRYIITKELIVTLSGFTISISSWQISLAYIEFISDIDFAHRVAFAAAILLIYSSFSLSLVYPDRKIKGKLKILLYTLGFISLLFASLVLITKSFLEDYSLENDISFTPIGQIIPAYLGVLTISVVVIFFRRYLKEIKSRFYFKYIILAFTIYAVFGLLFNLVLPLLGNTSYTLVGAIAGNIPLIIITYSIAATNIGGINQAIGNVFGIFLRAVYLYFIYHAVVFYEQAVFGGVFTTEALVWGLILAIVLSFVTEVIYRRIKAFVDKNIIYNKNTNPEELKGIFTEKIRQSLDLKYNLEVFEQIISSSLSLQSLSVEVLEPGNLNSRLSIVKNLPNLTNYPVDLRSLHEVLVAIGQKDLTLKEVQLKKYIDKNYSLLSEFLENNNLDYISVIGDDKTITGYVALSTTNTNEPFTVDKRENVNQLVGILNLSLTRSALHKKVEDFNLQLQNKIQEATTELKSKNNLLQESLRKEKDMIDILAHELRTPAGSAKNAVIMLNSFIKQHPLSNEDEKTMRYMGMAIQNLRRLAGIIEKMLNATKLDNKEIQLEQKVVEINPIVKSSINGLLDAAVKKNLKLNLNDANHTVYAFTDPDATHQILDNLILNAIKYTEEGKIDVTITESSESAIISIKDTGRGIPPEEIPNLGKKFYRIDNYLQGSDTKKGMMLLRPNGTGIGLYVVKGFVNALNGKLEIKSDGFGKGSEFIVYLPKRG